MDEMAEQTGLDLDTICFFLTASTYAITALAFICAFSVLRERYPMVYSHNVVTGVAPSRPGGSLFSWVMASMSLTSEEVIKCAGLDAAMMVEFSVLGARMMLLVGLPTLLVLAPLNAYFGAGHAAGKKINAISLANAEAGEWLDWVHAAMVWYVVSVVEVLIHGTRAQFLTRRYKWLRQLPDARANTIMVLGIPPELRTDDKLARFFNKIFSDVGTVKRAYVTRKTETLLPPWTQLKAAKASLCEAEATWKKNEELGKGRPMTGLSCFGLCGKVDSIDHFTEQVAELTEQVTTERKKVLDEVTSGTTSAHLGTGFVTFSHRIHRELALNIQRMYRKEGQLITWTPPQPQDILWMGLTLDPKARWAVNMVGFGLIIFLLLAYFPIVVGITGVALLIDAGPAQAIWAGVAPTLGMTIMNGFLPTLLIMIITACFPLKSMARVQHELQFWYFGFLVFLVLLAAAVGQNVLVFIKALIDRPTAIFGILADRMPSATTFYLNLVVLEWTSDAMNLLRLPELVKFLLWGQIYDEQKAKELSEPEDQDFNGIGARSARETILVAIGIVFCTLSPLIGIICSASLLLKRLVFGYLLVFAETRKPDLGGAFWVTKLQGLFAALFIYVAMMLGVLYRRSPMGGPTLLVAPLLVYVYWSMRKFETGFQWQRIPMCDVVDLGDLETTAGDEEEDADLEHPARKEPEGEYIQPELLQD